MVHVIVTVELQAGRRADFLAEFHRIVPLVLEEDGCLAYGPTTAADSGIEAQAVLGDDTVMIIEQWESLEHLKAHLVAPHMMEYRPRVKDMIASSTLRILQPA